MPEPTAPAEPVAFEAVLQEAPRGGAFIEVPAEVVQALGGGKRLAVNASFDGVAYQGSVVSMGSGMVLGVLKSIRAGLGKEFGDVLRVELTVDTAERTVTLPEDARQALQQAGALAAYEALSYSRRRELVRGIEEAKRPETRQRRIAAAVTALSG